MSINLHTGESHSVVYFDGECGLCNASVRWILARDRNGVFRFAPLQGMRAAERLNKKIDIATCNTLVLEEPCGFIYIRSTAVLRVCAQLGGVWRFVSWLRVVPRPLRDGVYRIVACMRHRLWRTHTACAMPHEKWNGRFYE